MRAEQWILTEDVEEFLDRAGGFLRSRPTMHHTQLTTIEKLRGVREAEPTVFGRSESAGRVHAIFYRRPTGRMMLSPLSPEGCDTLAGLGLPLAGVVADRDTADAFVEAWRRRTGAASRRTWAGRLYRLGTLAPPEPFPPGRGVLGRDRARIVRWCDEFMAGVGETPAASWEASRFADKRFTFWETPDGAPVSMAGSTPMVAGMVRVDPVFTPERFRGRGYAAAVTVAVSRAARDAGATDVVLFADPANATSNALYRRIGFAPVAEFVGHDFE
ncbi:N-acetyltransferase [Virgisporangium aliadipatigenens]|uniref:N-acetyltransferase n=1 Tax=Virgisporangium aliadipatigenens TaxID=741659 RepID=A0A8J4DVJ1_9ACTN|nr:GNAT family N-acetyltransferase [Virgisporangium aliadipatigenens]GIJ51238.1 N-acetyltransferase [Virgisporangium aliadipatigenens]